jgi:Leucine-rich repeat (LRR) protein
MSAINKLGTALAISTLTLAMFGCKGQSNSVSAPQTVTSASISSTSQNSVKLTLVCNNKGIQYLEGIEALTQLKSLYLSFNEINDITPLVGLKNLKTLYLSGNQISNLDALSELTELTELGIQKNNVQDLSPLQSLSMLKSLHTHSNQIQDFTILGSLELNELSGKKRQES